jgi:hypothetical protein
MPVREKLKLSDASASLAIKTRIESLEAISGVQERILLG